MRSGLQTESKPLLRLRLLWLLAGLFAVAVMIYNYPDFVALLYQPCIDMTKVGCNYLQLHADHLPALERYGFSLQGYALYALICDVVMTTIYIGTGLLIFWRASTERMGLFVSLILVIFGAFGMSDVHLVKDLPPPLNLIEILFLFLQWPSLGIFFYTFPDGRFVPRWSWMLTFLFIIQIAFFMLPYPYNIDNWPPLLGLLELFVVYGSAAATQFYRYFAVASPQERQQIKWLAFGFSISLTSLTIIHLLPLMISDLNQPDSFYQLLGPILFTFYYLSIALGVCVALLRFRLWDIDIVINRTVVYTSVSVCILALYMLVVFGASILLHIKNEWVLSALATAMVAVIIQPLRNRLQQGVNRLMFGDRIDPYRALSVLGRRLEESLPADSLLPTIVKSVAHALKLPYVSIIWNRKQTSHGDENTLVAAYYGNAIDESSALRLPLIHQGEQVGELILSPRQRGEELTSADLRLVRDLTPQIGIAVYSARLTADLKKMTVDLQNSRERLVATREEERRRLRRDLHDGLGPQLSSQTFTLSAIKKLLRHDPGTAEQLLTDAITHAQQAIVDIRRLVYALRPPSLDDLGLIAALQEQMKHYNASGVVMTLDAPDSLPMLPAAIEIACYRIVQEALTNVVRHAHATSANVRLLLESTLTLEISDNGHGLAPGIRGGIGFHSMRERAEELGGTFLIENLPKMGMRVGAYFPLVTKGYGDAPTARKGADVS
ncbi:GAF domain-containing sensor histidine kinase [Paenibacillus sp. MBLB4367]|uniref:GAF domain-containing sensor histidine kinase n=1 Tax=Paenibacillus sp. MBLB4367 TaxID=3384767 RepID=UPI00390830D2